MYKIAVLVYGMLSLAEISHASEALPFLFNLNRHGQVVAARLVADKIERTKTYTMLVLPELKTEDGESYEISATFHQTEITSVQSICRNIAPEFKYSGWSGAKSKEAEQAFFKKDDSDLILDQNVGDWSAYNIMCSSFPQ